MTYRSALQTIITMIRREQASPQDVALYISTIDGLDRWTVIAKVREVAVAGSFAEAVLKALEAPAKPRAEAGNPVYPALRGVDKFRKLANKRELSADETKAYGRAVLEGIRQMQRQELFRGSKRVPSARYETGADVLKRIAAENRARCEADIRAERDRRTDAEIIAAYEAAMVAKRASATQPEAPVAAPVVATITPKAAKPAVDHSARMRKAWETRRANAAKRAA